MWAIEIYRIQSRWARKESQKLGGPVTDILENTDRLVVETPANPFSGDQSSAIRCYFSGEVGPSRDISQELVLFWWD